MSATGTLKAAVPSAGDAAGKTSPNAARCLIVDDDPKIRHFLSLILHGAGVDAIEVANGNAILERLTPPAALIFLNVGPNTSDALRVIETLSKARYAGAVQLMSAHGLPALENLKLLGEQNKLRMLPSLRKPFDSGAIRKILETEKLGDRPAGAVKADLAEALARGWTESWYQPKINLRKKQLAGVELFTRVRHPEYGILQPGSFMPGADAAALRSLAEQTLANALKSGLSLSKLGINNLRIAVNMSLEAVATLPVAEIVRSVRPRGDNWAGLIIDITEEQVVNNIERAGELARRLRDFNVRLAIDDFGRGVSSLIKVKDIPFAEMKLDRLFVTNCSADSVNASICRSVIEMAHSFGGVAVGIGIENAADVNALVEMGCDLGQGYLLGQPMAEERFFALLKQRVAAQTGAPVRAAAKLGNS